MRASEHRTVEAIKNIAEQTGYPPSPEELAEVLGVSLRSLHASLIWAKNAGEVGYDEDGNLVLRAPAEEQG
jgi:Mn-dependent DtxR family transcriptional regulator